MSNRRPSWACRFKGHLWSIERTSVFVEPAPEMGLMVQKKTEVSELIEYPACRRCGEPNPNHESYQQPE